MSASSKIEEHARFLKHGTVKRLDAKKIGKSLQTMVGRIQTLEDLAIAAKDGQDLTLYLERLGYINRRPST